MANFNFSKVILGGRLTADPELKTTPSGISVCTFSVAVNRRGSRDVTDFLTMTAWRQTAEFVTRYFRRGSSICIVGTIQSRTWADQKTGANRYSVDIVADEAYFVDAKAEMPRGQAVVTPDSPVMAGAEPGTGKPAPAVYGTPGARQQFEDLGAEEDLPF